MDGHMQTLWVEDGVVKSCAL